MLLVRNFQNVEKCLLTVYDGSPSYTVQAPGGFLSAWLSKQNMPPCCTAYFRCRAGWRRGCSSVRDKILGNSFQNGKRSRGGRGSRVLFCSRLACGKQVVIVSCCWLPLLAPWCALWNGVSPVMCQSEWCFFFSSGGLVQEKVCGILSFMSMTRSH